LDIIKAAWVSYKHNMPDGFWTGGNNKDDPPWDVTLQQDETETQGRQYDCYLCHCHGKPVAGMVVRRYPRPGGRQIWTLELLGSQVAGAGKRLLIALKHAAFSRSGVCDIVLTEALYGATTPKLVRSYTQRGFVNCGNTVHTPHNKRCETCGVVPTKVRKKQSQKWAKGHKTWDAVLAMGDDESDDEMLTKWLHDKQSGNTLMAMTAHAYEEGFRLALPVSANMMESSDGHDGEHQAELSPLCVHRQAAADTDPWTNYEVGEYQGLGVQKRKDPLGLATWQYRCFAPPVLDVRFPSEADALVWVRKLKRLVSFTQADEEDEEDRYSDGSLSVQSDEDFTVPDGSSGTDSEQDSDDDVPLQKCSDDDAPPQKGRSEQNIPPAVSKQTEAKTTRGVSSSKLMSGLTKPTTVPKLFRNDTGRTTTAAQAHLSDTGSLAIDNKANREMMAHYTEVWKTPDDNLEYNLDIKFRDLIAEVAGIESVYPGLEKAEKHRVLSSVR
jgi:hypothetical protein